MTTKHKCNVYLLKDGIIICEHRLDKGSSKSENACEYTITVLSISYTVV